MVKWKKVRVLISTRLTGWLVGWLGKYLFFILFVSFFGFFLSFSWRDVYCVPALVCE